MSCFTCLGGGAEGGGRRRKKKGGKTLKLVRARRPPPDPLPGVRARRSNRGTESVHGLRRRPRLAERNRPDFPAPLPPSSPRVFNGSRQMLVGLDGAGKSTLLQAILGEPCLKTMPTFGFSNASTSRDGFDVDLFDLGGGKRIRGIWKAYTADVHGVRLRRGRRGRGDSRSPARCSRRRFATRDSAASPCSCARTSKTSSSRGRRRGRGGARPRHAPERPPQGRAVRGRARGRARGACHASVRRRDALDDATRHGEIPSVNARGRRGGGVP